MDTRKNIEAFFCPSCQTDVGTACSAVPTRALSCTSSSSATNKWRTSFRSDHAVFAQRISSSCEMCARPSKVVHVPVCDTVTCVDERREAYRRTKEAPSTKSVQRIAICAKDEDDEGECEYQPGPLGEDEVLDVEAVVEENEQLRNSVDELQRCTKQLEEEKLMKASKRRVCTSSECCARSQKAKNVLIR